MPVTGYRIRRSDRARRVRVVVHAPGDVEVVLPRRAPARAAEQAVAQLRGWIEGREAALLAARAALPRTPGTVPYLGEELELRPGPRVRRAGPVLYAPPGDGQALERWYRGRARAEIAPRLDAACAAAGLAYTRLSIRNQRTRWASCSSRGGMSFNWRLLLAPAAVLDYVVWHEVCHLEVGDHSARFWALLERHHPGWREPSDWLRRHGSALTPP